MTWLPGKGWFEAVLVMDLRKVDGNDQSVN